MTSTSVAKTIEAIFRSQDDGLINRSLV